MFDGLKGKLLRATLDAFAGVLPTPSAGFVPAVMPASPKTVKTVRSDDQKIIGEGPALPPELMPNYVSAKPADGQIPYHLIHQ